MRKVILATVIASVLAWSLTSFAEKKTILVKEYAGILVDDTNNFQVNGAGDLVTYSYAKDGFGVITAIYYTYTRKAGTALNGQIGPGPLITQDFIPPNSVAFEIIGLERNVALVLFTDNVGSKIYMVFRLNNKYANPTPNRTNPVKHIAVANEVCSITSTQVISYLDNPAIVRTVSNRSRTTNIAELTTSVAHGLSTGDKVTILDVPDNSYNLSNVEVISVNLAGTTFTYSCPGADEGSTGSTGTVYRPQLYNTVTVYNYNWTPQNAKGISNTWGTLSIINLILQKYYKGVNPNVNPSKLDISILKP